MSPEAADIPAPIPPAPDRPEPWLLWWRQVYLIGRFLEPTALHFVAALLPAIIYILVDQGAEILSMIGEAVLYGFRPLAALLFVVGTAAVGWTIWWSARVMLEFAWEPPLPDSEGRFLHVRHFLQKQWPRILGLMPPVLVAIACFVRVGHYHNFGSVSASHAVLGLGLAHLVAAGLLWHYFHRRRRKLARASQPRYSNLKHLFRESAESRRTQWTLLIVSLLTLLSLWLAPQFVAPHLGTGAMLSLALIAWVTIGTLFAIFRARTRVPVFFLLLVWVLINSAWMDNHAVRLSPEERPLNDALTVQAAFDQRPNATAAPGEKRRPLFLVATEGGGIRAAYWTATVLATLEQESRKNPPAGAVPRGRFAEHCFAISGVSGGSVGAAVFDALLADGREQMLEEGQQVLGRDHLAPLMGALLFPDALQRALPIALPGTDRGAVLERSWEHAYRRATGSNRLAQPFHDLWKPAPGQPAPAVPHLLLNSTSVNSGQRVIFSDLAVSAPADQRGFFDAVDMREVIFRERDGHVQPWDIPLSAAAHCSARFTYTNPAGLLSSRERVADGGYFENTGAATLREVLAALRERPGGLAGVQPVVIIISNDPQRQPAGTLSKWQEPEQTALQERLSGEANPSPDAPSEKGYSQEFHATKPLQFCSEVLSPIRALMHTREARGSLALQTLYHELGTSTDPAQPYVIRFQLIDHGIPLPLGWSLSQQAARDMQGQVWQEANNEAIAQVMHWLEAAAGGKK